MAWGKKNTTPATTAGKVAKGVFSAIRAADAKLVDTLAGTSKGAGHCRMLARRSNKECGQPLNKQGETCGHHICANEYVLRDEEYGGELGSDHKMGPRGRQRKIR